jgi:hypothetical protein
VASHLARLGAEARPAGSAAAAAAREYCRTTLADLGFAITEDSFKYSQFPGKWLTPLSGLLIPALATGLFVTRSRSSVWAILAFTAVSLLAIWIAMLGREGVLSLGFLRRSGINLEAIRGGNEPGVWLVAHIDSKWQPVSMVVRIAGVLLLVVGIAGLFLATVAPTVAPISMVVLWVGALPLMLSVVGARNHGTLDNASGVATVLNAVERLPHDLPLGVLITDAEELALAGARAWSRGRTPGIALNCDSVDDDGPLVVMYSGRSPVELLSKLQHAASAEGERLRALRLIPGILTDHVPLAEAGWTTLTLSRGTVRTLRRIHTSRDTLAHMDGRGIPGAAKVLARLVTELS